MEKASDLFPNLGSLIVFACYMIFCIGQGIFVTASHSKDGYQYNTVTVVFLTETVKLLLAYLCYIKDNSLCTLWHGISSNLKILCLYMVPSFLYCVYNNLAFINLSHFDPTSYFILLQLRVVITGIIFQLVFNKRLTKIQWMSLILLTFGCMIQQIDWNHLNNAFRDGEKTVTGEHAFFSVYLIFIVIQTLCSCFAGVYNEHLLKEAGSNVNIFIQNIFMRRSSKLL
ncbi:hypothetical protein RUM44_013889 [Polyplax serrata]|uniref:Uncharacterized protein n=1 Tax=Polyplax serrata TaxID=468196 RepID=A0ABR1BFG4_POLSC